MKTKNMEKIHLELKDYSHKERNQKIVEYLNLKESEIKMILTEEFKGYKNYFHFAVLFNYIDIAKVLIANGADVNDKFPKPNNHEFVYLLCYAAKRNFTDMTCLLIENGAEIYFTHLQDILTSNNVTVVKFIARNIDFVNGYFIINNILSLAIMYKQADIIKTFLCHVNMDRKTFLPFLGSAFRGGGEIVKVFVDYGPSLSSRDEEGLTAMEHALDGDGFLFVSESFKTFKLMVYLNSCE